MAGRGQQTITACFAVVRATFLSPEEKTLWLLYRSYDSGRGAWPSDDVLADHLDRSVRSIRSYRASLMEQGFLKQRLRGPRPAVYRAVIPSGEDVENSESPATDCHTSSEKGGSAAHEDRQQAAAQVRQPAATRVRKESTGKSTIASPYGEALGAHARGNGKTVENSTARSPPEPPPMRDAPAFDTDWEEINRRMEKQA